WVRAVPKLAAACLVVALASGGTVATSADTVPGDVLYPAKIAVERVQLATTSDDVDRARLHVVFADHRLTELERAVAVGDQNNASALTRRYADELEAATIALARAAAVSEPEAQSRAAELGSQLAEQLPLKNVELARLGD